MPKPVSPGSIIASLPSLSKEDVRKVRDLANMLLNEEVKTPEATPSPQEELHFQALAAELQARGIQSLLVYERFRATVAFKSWKKSIKIVDAFIDENFPGDKLKRKVARLAFCRYAIGLLIDNMKDCDIPITVGTVASNTHRIPEVFSMMFPGYLASGLGGMILAAMERGSQ